jgi:hypothetical protein
VKQIVYEVRTVERVERLYTVQFSIAGKQKADDEDYRVRAEEMVQCGEVHKFIEGNAEIEEVLSVTKRD